LRLVPKKGEIKSHHLSKNPPIFQWNIFLS